MNGLGDRKMARESVRSSEVERLIVSRSTVMLRVMRPRDWYSVARCSYMKGPLTSCRWKGTNKIPDISTVSR
jgi:hypothetical protein